MKEARQILRKELQALALTRRRYPLSGKNAASIARHSVW